MIAGNIVIGRGVMVSQTRNMHFEELHFVFPADTSVIDNILIWGEFMEYIVSFLFVLVLKSQHLFLLKF